MITLQQHAAEGDPDADYLAEAGNKLSLQEQAKSLQHLLTHTPKNPFCEACNRAKMRHSAHRKKGGAERLDAVSFGDHITGDHIISQGDIDVGFNGERDAVVLFDVCRRGL
jgi:hypothetical protein